MQVIKVVTYILLFCILLFCAVAQKIALVILTADQHDDSVEDTSNHEVSKWENTPNMARLHLSRSSYDFSVCDFTYDFKASKVTLGNSVYVYSSHGRRTISCSVFRRRSESEPYEDRREIIRKS